MMNNMVRLPARTIREMARKMLKGKYWNCVLIVLMCGIVADLPRLLIESITTASLPAGLANLLSSALTVVFTLGQANLFLAVFRGREARLDRVTDMTQYILQAVLMAIINDIMVLLCSFLLVIPGIICAIKNSLMYMVMADHPEMSPLECIRESRRLMAGNGFKLFGLDLSFFGWIFLSGLPLSIYQSILRSHNPLTITVPYLTDDFASWYNAFMQAAEHFSSLGNPIVIFLLSLIPLFVTAYIQTAHCAFYDIAAGNLLISEE